MMPKQLDGIYTSLVYNKTDGEDHRNLSVGSLHVGNDPNDLCNSSKEQPRTRKQPEQVKENETNN